MRAPSNWLTKRRQLPWRVEINITKQLSYYVLASTSYAQGNYTAARRQAEQAYGIAAEIDARSMMAYIAIILGNVARACGDYREAQQHYAHSYALQSELGNPEGMAIAQLSLAGLAANRRNYQEAERLFDDSYELYRDINDPGGQVRALIGLGDVAQAQGDRAQAGSYFCTGLELAIAIHSLPLLLLQLTPIGELLASAGEPDLADRCMDAGHAARGRRSGDAGAGTGESPPRTGRARPRWRHMPTEKQAAIPLPWPPCCTTSWRNSPIRLHTMPPYPHARQTQLTVD